MLQHTFFRHVHALEFVAKCLRLSLAFLLVMAISLAISDPQIRSTLQSNPAKKAEMGRFVLRLPH